MSTYFQLLRRNGWKIGGAVLVGSILSYIVWSMAIFILYMIGLVIGLAAIGLSPDQLTSGDPSAELLNPAFGVGAMIGILIFTLLYIVITYLTFSFPTAGMYGMINEAVLDGNTQFVSFFTFGVRYFWKVFLQMMLIILGIFLIMVPAILVDIMALYANEAGNSVMTVILVILYVLLLIPMFLFCLSSMFAPIILTAENKGPWESLKLSLKLFRKKTKEYFFTLLLLIAGTVAMIALLSILGIPFLIPLITSDGESAFGVIMIVLYILLVLLIMPFFYSAITMILSLRYKERLRRFIVPDQDGPGPFDGSGGANGSDPNGGPHDNGNPPQASGPVPEQPTDRGKEHGQSQPAYPQFPSDPHINS
ncbi:hypothetical protein [Salinithrix halophila]|uniref:Membrane domain of glycerophosphoryl diester phosphodiesterase n=1 Tax=Salinithrix halophila TaxID=1485204 RepID=A0ABV8JAU4_9BACL